ncbi:MAG TPA: alpha/beta fold hydrolase [Alloacidobacterium sp.]|nr:alpha/beta fold hydrolase [Alloacidobacterium sp.]
MDTEEFFAVQANEPPVRGILHLPSSLSGDCLVLTHGAGSDCNALLLIALAEAFSLSGITVLRCDLPFRQSRPHGPPPRGSAERDQQGLRAAIASMRQHAPRRMFLGGHSYGGRQASMLAAAEPDLVDSLLLLSYPLHPPQRPNEMRTAHFPHLQTPALFVHGTRDGFGSIEEITAALKLIPAQTELMPISGGGHELATERNREDVAEKIVKVFLSFAK